jgi:methionine biosynthesis protein MetW
MAMQIIKALSESSSSSPDRNASGFTFSKIDPRRYDGHTEDPFEVAGMVAAMIPHGARVLDVGCGTGSVTKIVAAICGADIVGVEPDRVRADIARQRGIDVRQGVLTSELLSELGAFDVILFADVLEHLSNPQEMLMSVRGALRAQGMVVASVPNVAHWTVRLDLLRGRFDYQPCGIMDATHLRWFTAQTLRRLFDSACYEIVDIRQTAGVTLPDYLRRLPWSWMRPRLRGTLIHRLSRLFPNLFGCQHVVRALAKSPHTDEITK